jgi:transposase, IS5 family
MIQLNSEILGEIAKRGLSINEGIAVDARLVKSASHPMSKDDLRKEREKRESPEDQVDKNGNPLKFCKDLESDWTVKNNEPHYGLKEHVSVDVENGFVLGVTMTPASEHDTKYLPYLALASCHTEDPIKKIYADKGYFGHRNRAFLNLNDIEEGLRLVEE